ncbi:unnamed protein product [Mytilus coruscus]|uniref:Ig-like domain-containing protein n=1 Tax=Mytilus coruscus TaxID=42192 RepID=A0A6J8CNZ9_MYTCO|nr:unnamed protein product [Mytilus coruscus]
MVSVPKYVMFQFLSWHINACTDLELLTKPVVFGKNVRLACAANDTEIPLDQHPSRSWSGGPFDKVLCMNAISADLSKYYEVLGKDRYEHILVIKNFSEADVGCEYKCIVGVDKTRTTLQLNEEDYEYIPPKETTTVTASLQYGYFSVNVHVAKVWPTPVCEIIFEDVNYGKLAKMSKRKNGKLYSVDISLKHTLRKEDCTGEMLIFCQIGTKYIEVQRKQFNTCPVTVHSKDRNVLNDFALLALVIAVFMILVMVFVMMISVIIKQKGYIKSIFELYFGYTGSTPTEIRWKNEPTLEETNVMFSHPQQEHPPR